MTYLKNYKNVSARMENFRSETNDMMVRNEHVDEQVCFRQEISLRREFTL